MIHTERQDEVVILSLDRPEKRNAMLPEMLDTLHHAIESNNSARAIVLLGLGRIFCAGFDLKACAADTTGETMRSLLSGLSGCVRAMRECDAPIVLGVHGAAVAGGCALLGGADVVLADREAKLGYPVTLIGVSPVVSAPFMLAAMRPGVVRARQVDPELIDARRAYKVGMVHELVDSADMVRGRAIEIGVTLANKPGHGCRTTKRWLNAICDVSDERIRAGLEGSLSLTGGDEERERLAALWG